MKINELAESIRQIVRRGTVIPAHPLALDKKRRFDEKHQRALTRYYIDAGAGGLAVGVHTTQFRIRDPEVGLYEPVLELASETARAWGARGGREMFKVAGVCGDTAQAVREAGIAEDKGYHACLLSLAALRDSGIPEMIEHCREVAAIMPLFGFYLQPAIGGRELPYEFWRQFAEIDNVIAIKNAPFDRYKTLDVIRAVCDAGREEEIALYTGNDDSIGTDLLAEYEIGTGSELRRTRIVGGLLGHWAVWTSKAVELLHKIHSVVENRKPVPQSMLVLAGQVTDCNAAFFDARNAFKGCIPGIHEVLRRQGLLKGTWCLDPKETLSPGQKEEIDRVHAAYPHLNDDTFVRQHLDEWLK